tara:strand:- start:334 stop:984 length:651 start_codon:yes stop_codon:yes gene_type:complete
MHDVEQGTVVITIGGTPEDSEHERLREIARGSGAAGHVQDIPGRIPDLVLLDHMDVRSGALEQLSRYGEQKRYEAGFGHTAGLDELKQLESMAGLPGDTGGDLAVRLTSKLSRAQEDMEDYQRFGGDVVAMELERETRPRHNEDENLLASMSSTGGTSEELSDVEHALAAMREHVGDDAAAEVVDSSGGVIVLLVATPHGESLYGYDVQSGSGRFQ